jgi:hypothetical protein
MKIFLSALETSHWDKIIEIDMLYNLMSYYYIRGNKIPLAETIRDKSKLIMIDSGAHSFQKGKQVDWEQYTREYADFIEKFDRPNVVGYFEMDVDNLLGYERVLQLRKILEAKTDKIIPVWHKNRGLDEFKKMCQDYAGRVVAITGFKNEDIKDEQYLMFLKYAKKYKCKVHCLGMTRKKILDKVPFDYVDSSSWRQDGIYGRIGTRKIDRNFNKQNYSEVFLATYLEGMKMQKQYERRWKLYE